MSSWPNDN